MKVWNHVLYLILALGMLAYAAPKLAVGGGWTVETVFAAVWICFALLIIAANLHFVLGVDAETRERVRQVKRMRTWQSQRRLTSPGKLGRHL